MNGMKGFGNAENGYGNALANRIAGNSNEILSNVVDDIFSQRIHPSHN